MSNKSNTKNGQQYQKWLFALSYILCKIGIGFISNFLLKLRVLHLTISKRKNLSLPLKVETDQLVICLVLPECLSVKICCISPPNSEANRDGADAESSFPLFFSFSASFKNSSPRENVGNCLRFWTGGWSLCFYPLWSRNIWIFFPTLTMAARAKKKFWQSDLLTPSASTIEIWSTLTYTEFDCAALLAMLEWLIYHDG